MSLSLPPRQNLATVFSDNCEKVKCCLLYSWSPKDRILLRVVNPKVQCISSEQLMAAEDTGIPVIDVRSRKDYESVRFEDVLIMFRHYCDFEGVYRTLGEHALV